jgi:hypothetical protein
MSTSEGELLEWLEPVVCTTGLFRAPKASGMLTSGGSTAVVINCVGTCRCWVGHPRREKRTNLKVLYVTGHIDRLMDARPLWEGEAFLDKPVTGAGVREAVSLLLHGTLKPPE